jgi:hypothetical protein
MPITQSRSPLQTHWCVCVCVCARVLYGMSAVAEVSILVNASDDFTVRCTWLLSVYLLVLGIMQLFHYSHVTLSCLIRLSRGPLLFVLRHKWNVLPTECLVFSSRNLPQFTPVQNSWQLKTAWKTVGWGIFLVRMQIGLETYPACVPGVLTDQVRPPSAEMKNAWICTSSRTYFLLPCFLYQEPRHPNVTVSVPLCCREETSRETQHQTRNWKHKSRETDTSEGTYRGKTYNDFWTVETATQADIMASNGYEKSKRIQ